MDGALVVDKPAGITSHDVVAVARRLLGERRIGHLGTLDPFATGVLVLLLGRATRLARFYVGRKKTYRGRICFGYATDTMDGTGQPAGPDRSPVLDEAALRPVFAGFVGSYEQRPPIFSAKKISGVPAYRLARKGSSMELAPVPVTIHFLKLLSVEGVFADFEARVSSGTYIRSLVNDIGERTGMGAHLAELRRTELGEFAEADALSLDEIAKQVEQGAFSEISVERLLPELPAVSLTEEQARWVGNGRDLEHQSEAARLRLLNPAGKLCAVAERTAENLYHPAVVLAADSSQPPSKAKAK